jgi:hypothetical protein
VKRASKNRSSSLEGCASNSPQFPLGLTTLVQGAITPQRWRERPRRWPRAWHVTRSFRVVAHAAGLLLAPASAVARPGGRHRAPPEDDGLQPARRSEVAGCARRARVALVARTNPRCWPIQGEHLARRGVPPGVPPWHAVRKRRPADSLGDLRARKSCLVVQNSDQPTGTSTEG